MSEFKTIPMLNSWELRIKRLEEVIDIKDATIAALRTRAEQAEAKVEKVREWALDFLPEDSGKYCELEQILK